MATLSQTGIPGVGNGVLHPKQGNRFRVLFQNIGVGGPGQSTDLSMQVVTCSRPSISFDEIPLHRYNSVVYIAGKHSWEPLSLTIEDDITGRASQIIQNQMESQQKLIGGTGPWLNATPTASGYKFGTTLEMLDGNETVTERWKLEGCIIMSVDYGSLDYSAADAVQISLSIRFDHGRNELAGQGYGTAIGGNL